MINKTKNLIAGIASVLAVGLTTPARAETPLSLDSFNKEGIEFNIGASATSNLQELAAEAIDSKHSLRIDYLGNSANFDILAKKRAYKNNFVSMRYSASFLQNKDIYNNLADIDDNTISASVTDERIKENIELIASHAFNDSEFGIGVYSESYRNRITVSGTYSTDAGLEDHAESESLSKDMSGLVAKLESRKGIPFNVEIKRGINSESNSSMNEYYGMDENGHEDISKLYKSIQHRTDKIIKNNLELSVPLIFRKDNWIVPYINLGLMETINEYTDDIYLNGAPNAHWESKDSYFSKNYIAGIDYIRRLAENIYAKLSLRHFKDEPNSLNMFGDEGNEARLEVIIK